MQKRAFCLDTINDTLSVGASGSGAYLHRVDVGTGVATAVVTVYEGSSTSGTVIATIDAATKSNHNYGGIYLSGGMFVKLTTAAASVTVVFS